MRLSGFLRAIGIRPAPRPPGEPGAEIPPPWVAWEGSDPWSFKQGENEAWLRLVFIPFWRALDDAGRAAYLRRWPPPEEHWHAYLDRHWL